MSRSRSPIPVVCGLVVLALWSVADASSLANDALIYHVETLDGTVVASHRADEPFNPASVVKVGSTLWALDRLGPDHRFDTAVGYVGTLDRETSTISGDIWLVGSDPDFHEENAWLVAMELNRMGVARVTGQLVATGEFTMGWENGIDRRVKDPKLRARQMGDRLLRAWDPTRWTMQQRTAWLDVCERRGWDPDHIPSIRVSGGVGSGTGAGPRTELLTHRSNPLTVLLRRFNVYSNNDIIRISDALGGAEELSEMLRQRLQASPDEVRVTTGSGQGRNRMTATGAVRLMRAFRAQLEGLQLELDDLLPVPGCDPGPTRRMFPSLVDGEYARTAVVKTGTLTTTDGGVVVLAGAFGSPEHGVVLFCVAATKTGMNVTRWRGVEEAWLLDLIRSTGGAAQRDCPPDLPFSDTFATIVASEAATSGSISD